MNTLDRWRDHLLRAVADAGLPGHPRRVRIATGGWALEGTLTIAGRTLTIALVVDPLFENKLPSVRLQPWDALGFIPHVDPSGVICYLDPEGMLLDQRRQLQVVRECLAEVRRTLLEGVTGANRADFADGGSAAHLIPITIVRRDRGFLVQRGGGHMGLESKRVLLLGCGSVGGHLAFLLARAGIGALTLVDHDILTPENTYRHVLGKPSWGKRKALAMKQALTVQLPFIKVRAIPEAIEAALDQNLIQYRRNQAIGGRKPLGTGVVRIPQDPSSSL